MPQLPPCDTCPVAEQTCGVAFPALVRHYMVPHMEVQIKYVYYYYFWRICNCFCLGGAGDVAKRCPVYRKHSPFLGRSEEQEVSFDGLWTSCISGNGHTSGKTQISFKSD
jgi:hypothetical protein